MASLPTIVVNGRRFAARPGDTLLNAALSAGIVIPHDCATGQCGTCRVRVYDGVVDAQDSMTGDTVLACRSLVVGDAVVEFDEVPAPGKRKGTVVSLEVLAPDVVQVTVALQTRLPYLPGQYVGVAFRGFPVRNYSPTLPHDGSGDLQELVFHIRRDQAGRVSGRLGDGIKAGSDVLVRGPFGHAYHRRGSGRLVLVSSGVGWAPIWAIARASILRDPERPLVVVAGARHPENLYMRGGLEWLRSHGATTTLTCSGGPAPDALLGRPTLYVPRLLPSDTVVAAGAQGMVAAVEFLAQASGATCYSDAFVAAARETGFLSRIMERLRNGANRGKRATIG